MHNRRFYKRMMSAVLAIAVLLCGMLVWSAAAEGSALKITANGKEITELTLSSYEKVELTAAGLDDASYQWQIAHPEDETRWVNIYDATEQTLSVTKALVGNVLDENDSARLRCRATTAEGEVCSDAVTVLLRENEVATAPVNDVMLLAEGDDDDASSDFVTVTIEYKRYDFLWRQDGKMEVDGEGNPVLSTTGVQAFTSYIATLQKGTNLNTTVNNPTMIGYDTYLGDDETASQSVAINLTNITEDVVFTVKYKPAKVDYSVRYFFQNIYDDLYVENASMQKQEKGYTGAMPSAEHMNMEVSGFTPLYYQPDSIAADGSTVFEVYYERNYYLMEFDCNGGYGAETLYNRYESYVSVPTPVRPGYVFKGWNLVSRGDDPDYVPDAAIEGHLDAIPAYNTAYQAVWEIAETTYTVVYWRENADDDGYSYWGSRPVNAQSNSHVSGTDHSSITGTDLPEKDYFSYNGVKTTYEESLRDDLASDGKVVVEGDGSTVVNVYYSRNYYTITFKVSGTCTAHVHGDDCEKRLLCGVGDHVHSSECVSTLTCTIPEHDAHTEKCFICKETEHTHGDVNCECTLQEHAHTVECCTKSEHSHSIACYSPSTGYSKADDEDSGFETYISTITNPKEGFVYRYRRNNGTEHYYFYDGETWYYLGTQTRGLTFSNAQTVKDRVTVSRTQSTLKCGLTEHTHGDGNCNHEAASCPGYEHTHGGSDCNCTISVHTHNDSCYSDVIHAHTDACYTWSCGASAHVHSEECYGDCIYPDHTHNNYCNRSSSTNTVKQVTRKYGADISDIWPVTDDHGTTYDDGQRWSPSGSSQFSEVLVFLQSMPNHDLTLTVSTSSNNTYTMYYYIELLEGEEDEVEYREYNGKKFKLAFEPVKARYGYVTKAEDFFDIAGFEQYGSDPQFGNNNRITISGGGNVYFYYTRKISTLKFHNVNTTAQTVPDLMYDYPLSDVSIPNTDDTKVAASAYEPPYPTTYEPGAYEFGGWYTTPQCLPGTEVKWDKDTMPDSDLEVYAKWTPIVRTVTFYSAYSDIALDKADESGKVYHFMKAEGVPHGTTVGSTYFHIPEHPGDLDTAINGGTEAEMYTFIGWFYMDEDNKKKFAPDSMEVNRNLELFAEWNTSVDTTYTVRYVLKEAVSAENTPSKTAYPAGAEVAAADTGHSSVGKTKTFTAKGLGDLYPDFQKKFFPVVNSHSILMEEKNLEDSQNQFTFEYVYDDTVYYMVRYLDYATKEPIHDPKIAATDQAVITEKFKPKEGYIPQSFYIRKALAYDGTADGSSVIEENVITFYYVKDEKHGLYSIEYYKENADSNDPNNPDNYTQYESIVGSADIGEEITATIRSYQGFEYKPGMDRVITYDTNGNLKEEKVGDDDGKPPFGTVDFTGLTIKIYYARVSYPYIVQYVESGSNRLLKTVETGTAKFDSVISRTAPLEYVDNQGTDDTSDDVTYEYFISDASAEERTKEIVIRDDSGSAKNVITFYYTQKKVEVQYIPICLDLAVPADMKVDYKKIGAVSLNAESAISASNLAGSNAAAADGFRFVGWFKDEDCTLPVEASWLVGDTYLKPGLLYQNAEWVNRYYALFEPVQENLTITKKAADGTTLDANDSFLFRIEGTDVLGNAVDITVSIQGAGSVTIKNLYCGTYTVKELTNWSWAYGNTDGAERSVTLTTKDEIKSYALTFTNTPEEVDWLHGEASRENQFNINDKT